MAISDFLHGTLDTLILKALTDGPRHGYEIVRLAIGGIGIVAGLGAAFVMTEWMSSFLYGVAPRDAATCHPS